LVLGTAFHIASHLVVTLGKLGGWIPRSVSWPSIFRSEPSPLDHALIVRGINRRQFTRLIYTSAGSDLDFVDAVLPVFPNVTEVYLISAGYKSDPLQRKGMEERLQRRDGPIRFHLVAADFFIDKETRIPRIAAGQTLFIDKVFGTDSQEQKNPRYHQALVRNSLVGDLIPLASLQPVLSTPSTIKSWRTFTFRPITGAA